MVSLLCKLATEVMQCVLQDIFFWCVFDDKEFFLLYFVVYFYDHFYFL